MPVVRSLTVASLMFIWTCSPALATSNPLGDDAQAILEDEGDNIVIGVTDPGQLGTDDEPPAVTWTVDGGTPPPVRHYKILTTDDTGNDCWQWRSITLALLNELGNELLNIDDDEVQFVIDRDGLTRCVNATVTDPIDGNDFIPSLEGVGRQAVPLPAFSVQPGNQPLVGQPSYLDEGMQMTWADTITVRFGGNTQFTAFNVDADAQGTVTEYWVDWNWDGSSEIDADAKAAGRSVTGPHTQAPRAWRDGNPGNVAFTYQDTGTYLVGVQTTWTITATVPGVSTVGPVQVTPDPGSTTITVRQAQPVRGS